MVLLISVFLKTMRSPGAFMGWQRFGGYYLRQFGDDATASARGLSNTIDGGASAVVPTYESLGSRFSR
jgi:hypothetical protein